MNGLTNNGIGVRSGAESSELLAEANCSPAAAVAFNYETATAIDWYLPSTDELVAIRDSGVSTVELAGSPGTAYWASTENTNFNAFLVLIRSALNPLDTGVPSTSSKATSAYVQPVRSF